MVCVHLDCPVADALEPIRAHASAEGVSAHIVAERILRGELVSVRRGRRRGADREDCGHGSRPMIREANR